MDLNKYQGALKGKRKLIGYITFCASVLAMYFTGEHEFNSAVIALSTGLGIFTAGNAQENKIDSVKSAAKKIAGSK